MTNDFFAELARCLHKKEIDSVIQKDRRLEVILHGQPALFVTPRNEVFLLPEMSGSEEANDLYHEVAQAADEVFSYVEAVQTAPLLHISGLSLVAQCWLVGNAEMDLATSLSPGFGTMAAPA